MYLHSRLIVEKANGALTLFLDVEDFNEGVLWEHHIPSIQDITTKFKGINYFIILDMITGMHL